jgi:hypothetical protein
VHTDTRIKNTVFIDQPEQDAGGKCTDPRGVGVFFDANLKLNRRAAEWVRQ